MRLEKFVPENNLEIFRGIFLVPANWTSRGVVVHVSGGEKLDQNQPVALAVTRTAITFCDQAGPVSSILLESIHSVKVTDLTGIALPVNTPSGIVDMVPRAAKGVSIVYEYSPTLRMELLLYMFTPRAAYEWANTIQRALRQNFDNFDDAATVDHR